MNENERSYRGDKARELLENEILREALATLDQAYINAWRKANTVEAREDAHRYVTLCKQFESDLKSVVKDGQMADHRTKELEGQKGGLRKIWG